MESKRRSERHDPLPAFRDGCRSHLGCALWDTFANALDEQIADFGRGSARLVPLQRLYRSECNVRHEPALQGHS
jgi:hypothetical protein